VTYRIRVIDGEWRLMLRGAIIGTFGTRIEAKCALEQEQERRGG
jgi:hypothetical protein